MSNNNRIESLDSLRGLASLSVVFNHIFIVTPLFFLIADHIKVDNWIVNLFTYSPLHMTWAGHEAVILFFVLSGFVLALPFLKSKNTTYPKYLIKRFCRIYIPYIASIGLSIFLFNIINPIDVSGMSENFNNQWEHEVSLFSLISYLFLAGYDTFNINSVTWSLVHEMRISIFFPLLMVFVMKFDWKKSLFYGLIASLSLFAILILVAYIININSIYILFVSFADTFYYTSFFIMGATLAKYREKVTDFVKPLSAKIKTLAFFAFVLLYTVEWIPFGFGHFKFSDSFLVSKSATILIDFITGFSVVILFTLVLSSNKLTSLLNKKTFVRLGKISYSLYLVHIIVLLTLTHSLHSYFPIPIIMVLVLGISILIAIPFYHFIEKPSIKIGKHLTTSRVHKNIKFKETKVKRA